MGPSTLTLAAACRETLRSDIIPNAYLWFTGEAAESEEEEDDEEGSEDDEDEEDDDDDDEQDDEASLLVIRAHAVHQHAGSRLGTCSMPASACTWEEHSCHHSGLRSLSCLQDDDDDDEEAPVDADGIEDITPGRKAGGKSKTRTVSLALAVMCLLTLLAC